MELWMVAGLGAVGLLQVASGVLFFRTQRALARLETRVGQITAGLSLLTDTTETGLRDVAAEIGRQQAEPPARPRTRAASVRRITGAARRGRSVREIAVAEGVSEGEVSLRLQLAEARPRRTKAAAAVTAGHDVQEEQPWQAAHTAR